MAGGHELEPIKYGGDLCQKVKTDFKRFKTLVQLKCSGGKEVKDTCKGQADLLDQRICIGARRSQAALMDREGQEE